MRLIKFTFFLVVHNYQATWSTPCRTSKWRPNRYAFFCCNVPGRSAVIGSELLCLLNNNLMHARRIRVSALIDNLYVFIIRTYPRSSLTTIVNSRLRHIFSSCYSGPCKYTYPRIASAHLSIIPVAWTHVHVHAMCRYLHAHTITRMKCRRPPPHCQCPYTASLLIALILLLFSDPEYDDLDKK